MIEALAPLALLALAKAGAYGLRSRDIEKNQEIKNMLTMGFRPVPEGTEGAVEKGAYSFMPPLPPVRMTFKEAGVQVPKGIPPSMAAQPQSLETIAAVQKLAELTHQREMKAWAEEIIQDPKRSPEEKRLALAVAGYSQPPRQSLGGSGGLPKTLDQLQTYLMLREQQVDPESPLYPAQRPSTGTFYPQAPAPSAARQEPRGLSPTEQRQLQRLYERPPTGGQLLRYQIDQQKLNILKQNADTAIKRIAASTTNMQVREYANMLRTQMEFNLSMGLDPSPQYTELMSLLRQVTLPTLLPPPNDEGGGQPTSDIDTFRERAKRLKARVKGKKEGEGGVLEWLMEKLGK